MRLVAGVLALTLFAPFVRAEDPGAAQPVPAVPAVPDATQGKVPLRVVRVMPESRQALLFDRRRATHVLAEVGATIEGYTVEAIDGDEVTLRFGGTQIVLAAPARSDRRRARDERVRAMAPRPAETTAGPAPAPIDPYGEPAIREVQAPDAARDPAAPGEGGVRVISAPGLLVSPGEAGTEATGSSLPPLPGEGGVRVITAPGAGPAASPAAPLDAYADALAAPAPVDAYAEAPAAPAAPAAPLDVYADAPAAPATGEPGPVDAYAEAAPAAGPFPVDAYAEAAPGTGPVPVDAYAEAPATGPFPVDAYAEAAPATGPFPVDAYAEAAPGGDGRPPTAAPPTSPGSPASGPAASPARPAASPARAASTATGRATPMSIRLSRAEVDAALADFSNLATAIRGTFSASGMVLAEVTEGSIFHRAGLRAGDTIAAIDGAPLRSLDDAANLYARAAGARAVTVQILRAGKPIALHVAIR